MKKKLILAGGGVGALLVIVFILNATGVIHIGGENLVAMVNGEGIKRSFLEGGLEQSRPSYEAQGVDFTDEAQVE